MSQIAPYPTPLGLFPRFMARQPESLALKEKVMSLSGDSFDIKLANGQPIFQVKGETFSLSHRQHFCDVAGNELFTIRKKLIALHSTYYAEDTNGNVIFEMICTFTPPSGKEETLMVKGNFFDTRADITDEATKQPVATIDRKFFNAREIFSGQEHVRRDRRVQRRHGPHRCHVHLYGTPSRAKWLFCLATKRYLLTSALCPLNGICYQKVSLVSLGIAHAFETAMSILREGGVAWKDGDDDEHTGLEEWGQGIAYRKAVGRAWKEAWEQLDTSMVDVILDYDMPFKRGTISRRNANVEPVDRKTLDRVLAGRLSRLAAREVLVGLPR
ncbi:hypothetical protein CIB48_g8874 [Xylaria polymorpha]|nr:hypothetical protein CIB48_g8874 [Xylaria polymorpha]